MGHSFAKCPDYCPKIHSQQSKKSLSRECSRSDYLSISRLFLRALIRSCLSFSLASFSARCCSSLKEKSCLTFSVKSLATSGKCSNASRNGLHFSFSSVVFGFHSFKCVCAVKILLPVIICILL